MTNWLKVNTIDTSGLVKKKTKKKHNAKIKNIEDNIPSITNLATADALTAVENKIPNVSTFVRKKKKRLWFKSIRNLEKIFHPIWL